MTGQPPEAGGSHDARVEEGHLVGGNFIKREHGVVIISVVMGLATCIIDAAMDAVYFSAGSLLDLFIPNIHGHKLCGRVLLLTSFTVFGVVASRLMARQVQLQEIIEQAKREWEETFDIINDAITIHDKDFNIIRANRAATRLLGVPFHVILSRKCHALYHGDAYPPQTCPSCKTLATGVPSVTETFEASLNKHLEIKALPRLDRDDRIIGVVHVVRDVTERVKAEEQLRALSLTDELTGLLNRRGFITLAEQQQKVAARMKKGFSILFADLDGLKDINDVYGHQEGCRALVETSVILRECFRESDIIGRIGGDEFVVFSMDNGGETGADAIAGRLQKKIADQNARGSRQYILSVSTGIAHCGPDSQCLLVDVMNKADRLMYAQKRLKKKLAGAQ